jgi:hypothetical protein
LRKKDSLREEEIISDLISSLFAFLSTAGRVGAGHVELPAPTIGERE